MKLSSRLLTNRGVVAQEMASQPSRPRRNVSPASSSKPQPLRATHKFSLLRNPSPTRGNPIRRPSPSSSPVHGTENGFKPRRTSPETRGSPEHRRSPTSPSSAISKVERPKPLKAGSVSSIRRTSSLDTISGTYMSGQWPREVGSYGPSVCHKATQTPMWDESEIEELSQRPKRSNSWGSAEHFKEKLRQKLQRNKQGSKSTPTYGRQSPLHGDHSAIQHKMTQSVAIPIPKISRPVEGPQRRSLEGWNSEVQTLVQKPGEVPLDKVLDPVDGHKAPVLEILSNGSPFTTVTTHTQTPAENTDSQESSSSGNSSSRSQSASPSYPIMAGTSDSRPPSRCSSGEGGTANTATDTIAGVEGGSADGEENLSSELPAGSKYASSPKPNNSYLFAREPPDGAEKVTLHVEDNDGAEHPQFSGPDKSKVKIIFSHGSAFSALPSFPRMAVKPVTGLLPPSASLEASQ